MNVTKTKPAPNYHGVLIGTLPPPINGQSVAFSMLVRGRSAQSSTMEVVDISERAGRRDRDFSFARVAQVLRLAGSVWRACRRSQFAYLTIAQSRWGFIRDALLIWTARLARCPIVVHLHGGNYGGFFSSESFLLRIAIRLTLRQATRIVVLSKGLQADFAFLGADRRDRIRVVPNGCPIPIAQSRRAPGRKVRLLYLSNLLAQKGYLDCIDAMVEVLRRLPHRDVKLVLAGAFMLGEDEYTSPHEMERSLRKHVRYLELEPYIEIAGSVEGAAKQELLNRTDIFILPTYYRNEGQPISLLEALASGLPSVVTSWRGISEIVCHEVSGLVVPSQDPIAIANAVVRLCEEPRLYENISAAAIQAAEDFTPERHVAALELVFNECARQRRLSMAMV